MTILTTTRLRLEPIDDRHLDGFIILNSDARVMRFITGRAETRDETIASIDRVKAAWTRFGYGWWAFIDPATDDLVGAGCVQHLQRDPANPLELGWRLRPDYWGKGYASEAACALAAHAFDTLAAPQVIAVCHQDNTDSAKVMLRLGMRFRGIEHWYDSDLAVYAMDRQSWAERDS